MDTPEKKAQIGSPVSNFEESPFSNFINSLSPIRPSKPIRISHTFGSISFSSPPSVFTSPQINLQRESRFAKREPLELEKPESSSGDENKDPVHEAAKENDKSAIEVKEPSKDKVSADAPSDAPPLALNLLRESNSDSVRSGNRTIPSFGCEKKSEPGTSSCVLLKTDSFGTQSSSVETIKNNGGPGCDLGNLMFDASDLLVFESPQGQVVALKEQPEKLADGQIDIIASLLTNFPEDDVNDVDQQHGHGPLNSDVQVYQEQDNDGSSSFNGSFTGQTSKKLDNKPMMHRGVRRRCLVYEIPGARKNVDGSVSATISQDETSSLSNSKQPAISQGVDSPMCIRTGFGLHLNAVALAQKGHQVLNPENLSSDKQLIPVTGSSTFFPSPAVGSENFHSSIQTTSLDLAIVGNEVQVAEDASQASAYGVNEDLVPPSPKKKKRRSENSGEGEGACKRCNCKKSKCLKLYCECFAAGVYCIDPCSCQDCFNKPIHEDTVLATRKQIESRNPLAFTPKVVRNSDSVHDIVDDSNRTPASARHKRGCNCKKSNCLKKYCECYQGGVGCSIGCRCEGCKNTFGRKDGSTGHSMDLDVKEDASAYENNIVDNNGTLVQPGNHNDEEFNPMPALPKTPLRLFRSPMPLPSTSNSGKPSRFGGISTCSLLNRDGTGKSTFIRTQHKTDKHPQNTSSGEKFPALQNTSPNTNVKTLSPNSKRISPPNHDDNLGRSPGRRSSRKLILQSIPSFPSLTPR